METVLNAQLTFFKGVTRRHTPFAQEPKSVVFTAAPSWGRRGFAQLERIGDLATRVWFYIELAGLNLDPTTGLGLGGARYVDDVGRAMIDELTIELGNVQYDKLYPEIMHAWEELTTDTERQLGALTGKLGDLTLLTNAAKQTQMLYVPLDLFFCSYENALPLVAMHLTDVKIYVKLKQKADIIVSTSATVPYIVTANDALINDISLVVETVVLDDTEREWFVSTPLKYTIHQWQLNQTTIRAGVNSNNSDLVFNHPVKELIVLFRSQSNTDAKNWFNWTGQEVGTLNGECFKDMSFTINSNVRVQPMDPFYYRIIQNRCHHTRIPKKNIYVYSFALYPEDSNPSGSLNFSRIDSARLINNFSTNLSEAMDQFVFAHNINVSFCFIAFVVCCWLIDSLTITCLFLRAAHCRRVSCS